MLKVIRTYSKIDLFYRTLPRKTLYDAKWVEIISIAAHLISFWSDKTSLPKRQKSEGFFQISWPSHSTYLLFMKHSLLLYKVDFDNTSNLEKNPGSITKHFSSFFPNKEIPLGHGLWKPGTPPRSPRINGLKSQILKPPFLC